VRHELDREDVRRVSCGNGGSELEGRAFRIGVVGVYIDVLVITAARKEFAAFGPAIMY